MSFSRVFSPTLLLRCVCAAWFSAVLLLAGGCAPKSNSRDDATRVGSTPGANAPAAASTTAGSTPNASWSDALQKWWQALSHPKPQAANPGSTAQRVPKSNTPSRAEIAALAARHPAWKLADALEKNRAVPLQFEAIAGRVPDIGSTLDAPHFDVRFPAGGEAAPSRAGALLPAPALASGLSPNEAANETTDAGDFAAPAVITPDTDTLRDEARARQEQSIAEFLRNAQARQENWQRDYRAILEAALDEDIEVAQERAPSALKVVLPSPELQLEMSNLRLKLLTNVFLSADEKRKVEARLKELMALWRAALAEQEKIRAEELQRLRVEEPARLRREGLTKLQDQLDAIRRTQSELRAAIAAEHRARLEAAFGDENTRLALPLPPLSAPQATAGVLPPWAGAALPPGAANTGSQAMSALGKIIFPRTEAPPRTSVSGFSGVAASQSQPRDTRSAQIHALRALAWKDAKRQAQMAQRLER